MSGNSRRANIALFGMVAALILCHPRFSWASAMKVESEEDDAAMSSSPKAAHSPMKSSDTSVRKPNGEEGTRAGDEIGFYYFVRAGFGVLDRSEVSPAGQIEKSAQGGDFVNVVDKANVALIGNVKVSEGDDLMVYRLKPLSGFPGASQSNAWVQNLGVARVLEVEDGKCLVKVTKSFWPIQTGDFVKPFIDEETRWKGAHVRKPLPGGAVSCWVADGAPGVDVWEKTDVILLTAGTKQGVVEGQIFQLNGASEATSEDEPVQIPQGTAKIFYAGPDFSTAQIIQSRGTIRKGFAAVYQP